MNLEEIENLWASQHAPQSRDVPPGLREQVQGELRRRNRLLTLGTVMLVFCVIIIQALFILDALYRGGMPSLLHLLSLGLSQTVGLCLLVSFYHRLLRSRQILRRRGQSLREVFDDRLAHIEAEVTANRNGRWFVAAFALSAALSAYANFPHPQTDWHPLLHRFGFIFSAATVLLVAIQRHYQTKLLPERDRLRKTLNQLRD